MSTAENLSWAIGLFIIGGGMVLGGVWQGYALLIAGPTLFVLIERAR